MSPSSWTLCLWAIGVTFTVITVTEAEANIFGFGKRNNQQEDLYATLGVSRKATADDIKKAFRKRTRDVHPDLKETAEDKAAAKEDMARINKAYGVLSNEVKRDTYDRFGVIAGENGVPSNAADGGGGGGGGGFEQFFRQQRVDPIKSKTPSIETVEAYRELVSLTTTEASIVLIQAYHDACMECRMVSGAWENLANSGWAYGAVRMHRIKIDNGDRSFAILSEAGLSYGPAPVVFAVVRGTVVQMSSLPSVLFREQQGMIQGMLFDFIQQFFTDTAIATTPVPVGLDALEAAMLHRVAPVPPPDGAAVNPPLPLSVVDLLVLVSDKAEKGLALSIQARYPNAHVMIAERNTMKELLLDVCRVSATDVRTANDMIVTVSLAPATKRADAVRRGSIRGGAWCPFFQIATSASSFSPSRALSFVAKNFQLSVRHDVNTQQHRGGSGGDQDGQPSSAAHGERILEMLHSGSSAKVCGSNCVVLLIASCAATTTTPDLPSLLRAYINRPATDARSIPSSDILEDLSPFQPAFMCLDVEPRFAATLRSLRGRGGGPEPTNEHLDGGFLVLSRMSAHASPKALFVPRHSKLAGSGFSSLQSLLADVIEGLDIAYRPFLLGAFDRSSQAVDYPTTLLSTLQSRTLTIVWWRSVWWQLSWVLEAMSGIIGFLPLVALWYLVRWCTAPKATAAQQRQQHPGTNAAPPPPHNRRPARGGDGPSPSSPTSSSAVSISPLYHVPFFASADMKQAESTKGFLVLIFHRKALSLPGPLPMSILGDARFIIRVVDEQHTRWWQWIDASLQSVGRPTTSHDASPIFVAVRCGRMLAHIKAHHCTIAVWCSELIDGSAAATVPLPLTH